MAALVNSVITPQVDNVDASPLASIRNFSTSTNPYLQQAALLYLATTDRIGLEVALSPSAPTAYLGAFISIFEDLLSTSKVDYNKLGGIAYLTSKIIPKASPKIINALFQRLSELFITTLKKFADVTFIAKTLLQCISATLRALPPQTVETSPFCTKLVQALFVFSVDPRPKIRKPAQQATERVFRALSTNSTQYLIPKQFEQALIHLCQLEFEVNDKTSKDCTSALHLCGLLKNVLYCLSTSGIAQIIAPLLQLTAQGNPFLLLQTFYTIASLYTKGFEFSTCLLVLQQAASAQQPVPSFLEQFAADLKLDTVQQHALVAKDVEFSYQLLLSVIDLKPNYNDVNCHRAFNTVLTAMYRVIYSFDPTRAMTKIVDIFQTLHDTLLNATKQDILASTLLTIKHLLIVTLSAHRLDTDMSNNNLTFTGTKNQQQSPPPSVRAILVFVRQLFMLPNMDTTSLISLLELVTAAMTHAKPIHCDYFHELLIIIETYHSKAHGNDQIQTACESVIGTAIEHFGPEQIDSILPLNLPQSSQITETNTVITQLKASRIWLLQLYPQHVRNATLAFFMKLLLPTATDVYQLAQTAKKQNRLQETKFLMDIVRFVWDSFPSFCLLPQDVNTNFKPLMKELVLHFVSDQFSSICQQPICKGLRNICAKNLAIVNGRWGKHDDLGLQRYSLDDDDLVMLHTPEQLKTYLNRRENKGKTAPGEDDSDSDDDSDDEDEIENQNAQISTGEEKDDDNNDDDDDGDDQLGLYNQTTSIARKRANNKLYNKKQIIDAPIGFAEAKANCAIIGALSKNILPLLFNTVVNTFRDNHLITPEQQQTIPIALDAILAYTCTAEEKVREQLFTSAFQQFIQVSQEISKIYTAIEDCDDGDFDNTEEMPTLDQSLSRPKLQDVSAPIRKSRALGDILIAMSPALSDACVTLYLQSIILNFNSPSDILQKKAYSTVQALITINKNVFDEHWQTVLIAISTSSANIQPNAHRARLLLCRSLYSHLQSPLEHKDVISTLPSLLSEAILATKETNNKLRSTALDLAIAIGINIYNSGLTTGQQQQQQQQLAATIKNQSGQQLLTQYITMVLAGLAATTPRMLSATINVVSRLVFEFKSVLAQSVVNDIFQTILILLPSKSREILKSILAFIKVAIITLTLEALRPHIHDLLFAISDWRPQEKSHFKRPVRILYQLLIKKFGLDFMRQNTPPDDIRLVEYLRKQQIRVQNIKEREKKEFKQQKNGEKVIDAVFGANTKKSTNMGPDGDQDEDDFIDVHRYHAGLSFDEIVDMDTRDGDDDLGFSAADMLQKSVNGKKNVKKGKNSKYDEEDFVQLGDDIDFLETNVASKLKSKIAATAAAAAPKRGKIMDDDEDEFGDQYSSEGIKRKSQGGTVNSSGKLDFTNLERTIRDEERQARADARQPTDREIKDQRKRQRLMVQKHQDEKMETHAEKNKLKLGSEFTSSKGVGDVKRRGMKYDPYAYVPLDPRTLNTKKLSLRQQSKHFAGMFQKNAVTGGTASSRGPGQRLSRGQRDAMRKKGGKYTKARDEDDL